MRIKDSSSEAYSSIINTETPIQDNFKGGFKPKPESNTLKNSANVRKSIPKNTVTSSGNDRYSPLESAEDEKLSSIRNSKDIKKMIPKVPSFSFNTTKQAPTSKISLDR